MTVCTDADKEKEELSQPQGTSGGRRSCSKARQEEALLNLASWAGQSGEALTSSGGQRELRGQRRAMKCEY
ncbi:hypothetical protein NDU88_010873 [Pleurodeles waltl]|uniref:Uncharacterized protein n=1 Tax=Pleurodeles waltl TaxID=8319 RepID=A0AAV7PZ98_PLEWA|nr:hypothetical protein NDU88_010873 [Pleurodeles waltl]